MRTLIFLIIALLLVSVSGLTIASVDSETIAEYSRIVKSGSYACEEQFAGKMDQQTSVLRRRQLSREA